MNNVIKATKPVPVTMMNYPLEAEDSGCLAGRANHGQASYPWDRGAVICTRPAAGLKRVRQSDAREHLTSSTCPLFNPFCISRKKQSRERHLFNLAALFEATQVMALYNLAVTLLLAAEFLSFFLKGIQLCHLVIRGSDCCQMECISFFGVGGRDGGGGGGCYSQPS